MKMRISKKKTRGVIEWVLAHRADDDDGGGVVVGVEVDDFVVGEEQIMKDAYYLAG